MFQAKIHFWSKAGSWNDCNHITYLPTHAHAQAYKETAGKPGLVLLLLLNGTFFVHKYKNNLKFPFKAAAAFITLKSSHSHNFSLIHYSMVFTPCEAFFFTPTYSTPLHLTLLGFFKKIKKNKRSHRGCGGGGAGNRASRAQSE